MLTMKHQFDDDDNAENVTCTLAPAALRMVAHCTNVIPCLLTIFLLTAMVMMMITMVMIMMMIKYAPMPYQHDPQCQTNGQL